MQHVEEFDKVLAEYACRIQHSTTHLGFSCDCLGEERLAHARLALQQHALGRLGGQPGVLGGVAQELRVREEEQGACYAMLRSYRACMPKGCSPGWGGGLL